MDFDHQEHKLIFDHEQNVGKCEDYEQIPLDLCNNVILFVVECITICAQMVLRLLFSGVANKHVCILVRPDAVLIYHLSVGDQRLVNIIFFDNCVVSTLREEDHTHYDHVKYGVIVDLKLVQLLFVEWHHAY